MNQTAQSEYAQTQARLFRQMDTKYVGSVYRAIKAQNSSFIFDLKSHGLTHARAQLQATLMNHHLAPVIKNIHQGAGLFMARRVRQMIKVSQKKLKGAFGFNEQMIREIQEYFRIFLLEKAVLPITRTTIERINTILDKAIAEGWGVDQIVAAIEGQDFLNMTRARARTIVRTEVVRASNFGGMAAAFDSDYEMEKIWIEVKDARTRLSHRHGSGVGGQVRDLLSPFSNGGQFPGDPDLPAKESINCRCTLAFRLARDLRGRPIPKKPVLIHAPAESLANILAASIGFSLGSILANQIFNR